MHVFVDFSMLLPCAEIQGPDGTVYAKGIFKLEIEIPDRLALFFLISLESDHLVSSNL